jgi:predicted DNA-binding transcriptional regulator AlpA
MNPHDQKGTHMDKAKQFDRFINIKEVMIITSVSKSQIYALAKQNKFPGPYDLSDSHSTRCSRWSFLEVNDWITSKMNRTKVA